MSVFMVLKILFFLASELTLSSDPFLFFSVVSCSATEKMAVCREASAHPRSVNDDGVAKQTRSLLLFSSLVFLSHLSVSFF
jgi:hypothetical protein